MNYIENKINIIKNKQLFGVIIENGVGTPVYNTLCKYPNTASNHVNYIISSNNLAYNKLTYNYNDDLHDPQNILNIINSVNKNNTEYIFVNSIQILNNITIGWFGLYIDNNIQLYHFTINEKLTRIEVLQKCAEIGLDILASTNNFNELNNGFIDNILNSDLSTNKIGLLKSLSNAKLIKHYSYNTTLVFNTNNDVNYFNDILINNKKIIIIKDDYNLLLNEPKDNLYFCISLNNNKNIDILSKIQDINKLGYNVIVDYFNDYHYSYTSIINNINYNKHKIQYLMYDNTFQKLLKNELVITDENEYYENYYKKFNIKWSKCSFIIKQKTNFTIHNNINNIIYK